MCEWTCVSTVGEIRTEQERKMKRLMSMLFVVAALCAMLVIPAAAAGPVEVSGAVFPSEPPPAEYRPIGTGDDEHYCLITVDSTRALAGPIEGTMFEHYEILSRGTCGSGPGTNPTVQRAWGEFTGEIGDGEQMRSGTCKTFWHGGWDWNEEGTLLVYEGRLTLHECTGALKGAHANLEIEFIPGVKPPTYAGRAFFSGKP
jgi:hypothetical protein